MKQIKLTANEIRYIEKLIERDSNTDTPVEKEDEKAYHSLRVKL